MNSQPMPNCLIIPSGNGKLRNCIQMPFPSSGAIIMVIIISWIILMAVAWIIYWFVSKTNQGVKFNYWLILLILIVSGLIVSLFL